MGLATAEILFGCWIISGLYPRLTRWLTALCFLVFFGSSLTKALSGEANCGCFGPVPINPWVTAAVDGFVLATLFWIRPVENARPNRRHWAVFTLLSAGSGAVIAVVLVFAQPVRLSASGGEDGAIDVLRPEEWVGRPCPLIGQIDMGDRLSEGDWVVMLHRPGCEACRNALPLFEARATVQTKPPNAVRWALVEVPEEGVSSAETVRHGLLLNGRLRGTKRWVVRTPVILYLRDGVVTQVTHSLTEVPG
jgi:hypothetical protein